MTASDTWITRLTAERDTAKTTVLANLAAEDAGTQGLHPVGPGTRGAIDELAQAQARLDVLTAATE